MRTINRIRLLTGAAALALTASLGATPGLAQTSATMNVTASIEQSCSIGTISDLAFGVLDGTGATAVTQYVITCSAPGTVDVTVGPGTGNGGDITASRKMVHETDGTAKITYTLLDEDNSTTWGSTPVTKNVIAGANSFDINGSVGSTASDGKPAGSYSDQVTISFTF